jgi:hypothetical protein
LSTRENARLLDALDHLTKRMLQEEDAHTGSLHERERLDSERRSLQVRVEAQDAQCRQLQQRLDEQQRLLGRSEEQKTRLERLAERTAEENERLRANLSTASSASREARDQSRVQVQVLNDHVQKVIVRAQIWNPIGSRFNELSCSLCSSNAKTRVCSMPNTRLQLNLTNNSFLLRCPMSLDVRQSKLLLRSIGNRHHCRSSSRSFVKRKRDKKSLPSA